MRPFGSRRWFSKIRPFVARIWEFLIMAERWLSVDAIAAHLGVNPETIYKWITRKRLPAHKVGRLWKFLGPEVDQWVKGGQAGAEGRGADSKGAN